MEVIAEFVERRVSSLLRIQRCLWRREVDGPIAHAAFITWYFIISLCEKISRMSKQLYVKRRKRWCDGSHPWVLGCRFPDLPKVLDLKPNQNQSNKNERERRKWKRNRWSRMQKTQPRHPGWSLKCIETTYLLEYLSYFVLKCLMLESIQKWFSSSCV